MKNLLASDKIYVAKSQVIKSERGVFARIDIKKGEIIERCPVIAIPKHDFASLRESILVTYFFYFGKTRERLVVVLGFGSIYNHTYTPNATYKEKYREKAVDFVAIKEIKKDEEITVNYSNRNSKDKNPLWFKVASSPK